MIYTFAWGNTPERMRLKGRRCRVLVVGRRMGSVLVQFEDNGERHVISRRALRRIP